MKGDTRHSRDQHAERALFKQELESLEKLRRKLLDLTTRNRLLNYKEGVRSIRISNESSDEVFKVLVAEGQGMELVPLAEYQHSGDQDSEDRQPGQTQLILLPSQSTERLRGDGKILQKSVIPGHPNEDGNQQTKKANKLLNLRLQTQFAPDLLERRCKRILYESRTAIEESGANLFHLAIGFLEWFEDANSEEVRRAPIANKTVGPNEEKIHEIFWILEKLRGEIPDIPIDLSIEGALQLTRGEISERVEKLEDAARLRRELPDSVAETWEGFRPEGVTSGDDARIRLTFLSLVTKLDKLFGYIEESSSLLQDIAQNFTVELSRVLSGANPDALVPRPVAFHKDLDQKFFEAKNVELLRGLAKSIATYSQLMREAGQTAQDLAVLPSRRVIELIHITDFLVNAGWGDKKPSVLQNDLNDLTVVLEYMEQIQSDVSLWEDFCHEPLTRLSQVLQIVEMHRVAKVVPLGLETSIHPPHALASAQSLYSEALRECTQLSDNYAELCKIFEASFLPGYEDLTKLAYTLRKHKKSYFAFLSREYRQARRSAKAFLVDSKLYKSVQLDELLVRMADTMRRIEAIKMHEDYSRILGPLYLGVETDWNRLDKLVSWSQEFRNTANSEESACSLLQNFSDVRERLIHLGPKIQTNCGCLSVKITEMGVGLDYDSELRLEVARICNLRRNAEKVLEVLPDRELFHGIDIGTINASCKAYSLAVDLRAKTAEDRTLRQLLGSAFDGVETDIGVLLPLAEWVQNLAEKSRLPRGILQWLVESRVDAKIDLLKGLLAINSDVLLAFDATSTELKRHGTLDGTKFFGGEQSLWSTVGDKARVYLDSTHYLVTLSDYHKCVDEATHMGLESFVDLIHSNLVRFEECAPLYKYLVYTGIAKSVIKEHRELTGFTRTSHENILNRFVTLDVQLMNKTAKRIAHKISQNPVPHGVGLGPVKDYTDFSLLGHEIQKKKKHIPIRQLVRRAGRALVALKPCFMMSPLSVAQYLEPGKIEFDLVLMDEASQIRPADALGAIARAKQLVIVGDPNQLPPTSFFERLGGDEYAEDGYAVTDTESILDACMAIYPRRRLRWHYRSRHESLIAFSNNQFYENDLIVFPTNQRHKDAYGVKHHYVEGATYLKGRNRDEAMVVARAIISHFRDHPDESLGVATFNREQSELILDLLERFQKNDEWLEQKIKQSETSNEPFFVKNLENVQGDERDVIFISMTYGPDPTTGHVYQRFGPITEDVGWRRLNVIVTRAKMRVEVFTSMRSSDIHPAESSSRGVRALKEYLAYAEKGTLADFGTPESEREPGSDFELSVARILKTHGHKVVPQVGVAGFFIDIGVRHPRREGEYILGIECDGAAYHSAKSVRDRDRLRQEILEIKGWRIHRIWSVDWFKNREKEIQRLLNAISKILREEEAELAIVKEDAVEGKRVVPQKKDYEKAPTLPSAPRGVEDQLREELVHYRETNILPRFPDVSKGILRDEVLSLFVRHKPTTKDEFYHVIPQTLRMSTDGGQMQFLEDILEIIEGYAD